MRRSVAFPTATSTRIVVANFRRVSPVPLGLTSPRYQLGFERLKDGLRSAGMPERSATP